MAALIGLYSVHYAYAKNTNKDYDTLCENIGGMSWSLMGLRQAGVPMSKVMKGMEGVEKRHAENELVRYIIIEAYQSPAYSSKKAQERAQNDFRNKQELHCYENVRKFRNK